MSIDLHSRPHVVATVTRDADLSWLQAEAEPAADILEYRLDDLLSHRETVAESIEAVRRPVLLTVRRPDEGGAGSLADEERLAVYREFLPAATLVDTEIASLAAPAFEAFPARARERGVLLVGSHHDFNEFPGIEHLREQADAAGEHGCDVIKFAVVLERMDDLFSLAGLVEEIRASGRLVSAMGMGGLGRLSRLVLAKAGSCLNYGYLQSPNAPGQWSASELTKLLGEI